MLVLTRRKNQEVFVGDVSATIVEIRDDEIIVSFRSDDFEISSTIKKKDHFRVSEKVKFYMLEKNSGASVSIGIEAPEDVDIVRDDIVNSHKKR